MNQETPALDIPAIDYVIQGDREYCRLQQELNEANERNDGHAIARIHGQLETLDAWTINLARLPYYMVWALAKKKSLNR